MTWQVCADTSNSGRMQQQSMFYESSARSHIISFDEIYVESPKLQLKSSNKTGAGGVQDTFTMKFDEAGIFSYGCCIFSRMRGSIEVMEHQALPLHNQYLSRPHPPHTLMHPQ